MRPTRPIGAGILLLAGITLLGALFAACTKEEKTTAAGDPARRSILLLTIDALRADHLSTYGYSRETAPFLAGLASKATVYQNAQSTSSWTAPALASLVTGVYPRSHGVLHGFVHQGKVLNQESLPPALPTLAGVLKQAGYATFGVVSNLHAREEAGFGAGFDGYQALEWSPAGKVNRAVLQLKDQLESSDKPAFLWIHYFDPHLPYSRRNPWYREHKRGDLARAADLKWDRPQIEKLRTRPDEKNAETLETRLKLAMLAYDSEIAYTDDHLRQLFEAMPFLHEWHLIMSADHGEEFLDHGYLEHGFNLHRETLRVPLFILDPDARRPSTVDTVVSWIDLAPTIAALAGAEIPGNWQGLSLAGGPGPGENRAVIASLNRMKRNMVTVVDGHWKLIIDRKNKLSWLYDLDSDPKETRNLAAARSATMKAMGQKLKALRRSAPGPAQKPGHQPLGQAAREQLRSLGYVE